MKKPFTGGRGGGFKGGKKFGGGAPWKRGGGSDFAHSERHEATCNNCGKPCQVPFKPNGIRPVYCSSCYKKEGNVSSNRFGEKRSLQSSSESGSDRKLEIQLKRLEDKIDIILDALNREL